MKSVDVANVSFVLLSQCKEWKRGVVGFLKQELDIGDAQIVDSQLTPNAYSGNILYLVDVVNHDTSLIGVSDNEEVPSGCILWIVNNEAQWQELVSQKGQNPSQVWILNELNARQIIRIVQQNTATIAAEFASNVDQLKKAQQLAKMGSWEWDVEKNTFHWSETMFELFNRPKKHGIPSHKQLMETYLHPNARKLENQVQRALRDGLPFEGVFRYSQTAKSCIKYLNIRALPIANKDGKIERFFGIAQDVTQRERLITALERSELLFSQITNKLPAALLRFKFDDKGQVVLLYANDGVEKLYGVDTQTLLNTKNGFFSLLSGPNKQEQIAEAEKALIQQKAFTQTYKITTPYGTEKWVKNLTYPTRLDDGTCVWDAISYNVTDEKTYQKRLQEKEAYWHSLLENLPVAVYTTNTKGVLLSANNRAIEIWGRTPQFGKEKWCGSYRIFNADGEPVAHEDCTMAVAIKECRSVHHAEGFIERHNGDKVHVLAYASPIINDEEEFVGGLNVLLDISEQKDLELHIAQREKQLSAITKTVQAAICQIGKSDGDELNYYYVNDYALSMLGGELPTELNQVLAQVVPNDRYKLKRAIVGMHAWGYKLNCTVRIRKGQNEIRWLNITGSQDAKTSNRVVWDIMAFDITQERKVQQDLEYRQELLNAALNASLDAIYFLETVTDENGEIVDFCIAEVNENACDEIGMSREELIGYRLGELFPIGVGDESFEQYKKAYLTREPSEYSYEIPSHLRGAGWYSRKVAPVSRGVTVYNKNITQERNTTLSLKHSEKHFKSLFQDAPLPKLVYNTQTLNIVQANQKAQQLYGYSLAELLNMSISDLRPPGDRVNLKSQLAKHIRSKVNKVETIHQHKTGTPLYVEVHGANLEGLGKNNRQITIIDQTTRHLAESERDYHKYALEQHAIVSVTDYEGKIIYVNSKFEEVSGYSSQELIGRTHGHVSSEVHDNEMFKEMHEAIKRGEIYRCEICNKHKNGEHYWLNMTIVPKLGHLSQQPESFVAISTDITERKNTELQLKKEQERLNAAIEGTEAGLWDWDLQTDKVVLSLHYAKALGYKLAELSDFSGERFFKSLHVEDRPAVQRSLEEHFSGKSTIFSVEFRQRSKSGHWRWFFSRGKVIDRDTNGKPIKMVGSQIDITDNKDITNELGRVNKRFELARHAAQLGVWDWNVESNLLIWDEMMCDIFEVENQDRVSYAEWLSKVHPDDVNQLQNSIEELLNQKEQQLLQYRILLRDGSVKHIKSMTTVLRDIDNKPARVVGLCSDNTHEFIDKERNELFAKVRQQLHQPGDLQNVVKQVTETLTHYGDFILGEFWLHNYEETGMRLFAQVPVNQQAQTFIAATKSINYTEIDKSYLTKLLETKKPIVENQLYQRSFVDRVDALPLLGAKDAMMVPITHRNKLLGVFTFFSKHHHNPHNPLSEHRDVLGKLAEKIGGEFKQRFVQDDLNRLFNISPDILCIYDGNGNIKRVNPAFGKTLGYADNEIPSLNIRDLALEPNNNGNFFARSNKDHHPTVYYENRYITKDGDYKWLSWTETAMPEPGLFFAVAKDITEKKKLEHERENLLNSITDGFFAVNENWEVTYWNKVAEHITGVQKVEILGRDLRTFFNRQNEPIFYEKFEKALKTKSPVNFVAKGKTSHKWLELTVYPAEQNQGLTVFFKDISKQRAQKLALQKIRANQESMINSTEDLIWSMDAQFKLVAFNKSFDKRFSQIQQRSPLVGDMFIPSNLSGKRKKRWKSVLAKALSGERFSFNEKGRHPVSGEEMHYLISFNPILSDKGKVEGISCFAKDITESIQQIEAIEMQNQRLRDIAWMQAHEVRAPIARILGIHELINDELQKMPNAELNQWLEHICSSVVELDNVVKKVVKNAENVETNHLRFTKNN